MANWEVAVTVDGNGTSHRAGAAGRGTGGAGTGGVGARGDTGAGAATPDVEVPLYLQLLWHGEDAARPGPRRGVDLRTIGAAGVRVADAEGLSAVTMRRLATELGFTTMALYRYVQSKSELLMLVTDSAYGPPPPPRAGAVDWRSRIHAWAGANRDVIVAHPWILQVQFREPPLTPHQVGWMEAGLEALAVTGLNEQEKLSSMLLVDVYVRGQLQLALGINPGGNPGSNPGSGDSPEPALLYGRRLASLIDQQSLPRISAALLSGALDDEDSDMAVDEFAFGLDTVLEGIAARVASRAAQDGGRAQVSGG